MENIIDNIKSILEARSSTKEHVSECDQKLSEFNTMLMDVDTELNVTKVLSGQNKSLMDLSYNAKKYVDKESSNIMMEAKKIYNDCREIGECSRINYDFFLKCDILHNELEEKLTQSINEHNLKLIEVQEQSDRLKKELEDGIVEHNETLSGLEKEVTECENNVQSLCKLIDQENSYLQCLNVDEKTRENNDLLEGISLLTIQLESIDNSMNNYKLQLEELNCEFNKEIREREAVKKLLAEDNEKMQTEYTTLMTNPNEENNLLDDCKSKITNAIKIKTEKNENLSDINNSIQSMECEIENISHLLESEIPLKVESVDKLRNCVFTEESLIRELSQQTWARNRRKPRRNNKKRKRDEKDYNDEKHKRSKPNAVLDFHKGHEMVPRGCMVNTYMIYKENTGNRVKMSIFRENDCKRLKKKLHKIL